MKLFMFCLSNSLQPFLILCLFASLVCLGQVIFKEPKLRSQFHDRLDVSTLGNYATFSLPPLIDNQRLALDEEANMRLSAEAAGGLRSGPFLFAKPFTVDLNMNDGGWVEFQDAETTEASLWRLAIESKSAKSLHLRFDDFQLPAGAELYVVSLEEERETAVLGPFTELNNKIHRQFSFLPMRSSKILLELYLAGGDLSGVSISISSILHGYKEINQGLYAIPLTEDELAEDDKRSSGSCNVNVVCKEGADWKDQSKGVAMLLTADGAGYCSGSMVNNLALDGRQLYLTAFHCMGRDVDNDIVQFNYEADACESRNPPRGRKRDTAHGLKKLAGFHSSDFTLLEVEERIPESYNVYLNGWSAQVNGFMPQQPVGIHHPSADIKKISFSFVNISESCWQSTCGRGPKDHWRIPKWSIGTTEPGSSGSPLFDGKTKRIVGQLHGGSASCYNTDGYDVYGKVQVSYDSQGEGRRLKDVLDPRDSGLRFQDGIALNDARKSRVETDTEETSSEGKVLVLQ